MNASQSKTSGILNNPFFHRGPIRERDYFFGRGQETGQASSMLRNSQCVSIVGPRRIGKSSLLFHLCDPRVQREHKVGEEFLFIYIDCQGLGDFGKGQFYRWLWQETCRVMVERDLADEIPTQADGRLTRQERLGQILATHFSEEELRTLCFDLKIAYDDLPARGKANKASELLDHFERHRRIAELVDIGRRMRPDIAWSGTVHTAGASDALSQFDRFRARMLEIERQEYTPVFLFDEFDAIALNPSFDRDLFSDLRSLVPTLIYVTASHESLDELTYADTTALSSPFFNVFHEINLGLFSHAEAKGMIRGLLDKTDQRGFFNDEDLAFIFEIGGHHPFFLQLACYYLFEEKYERKEEEKRQGLSEDEKKKKPEVIQKNARQTFLEHEERHFRYIWKSLGLNEQRALWAVCRGKIAKLEEEQRQQLKKKSLLDGEAVFSAAFAEYAQKQIKVEKLIDRLGKPLFELGRKTRKVFGLLKKVLSTSNEIIRRMDRLDENVQETKSMVKRLPHANIEPLRNFEGFAVVEIVDAHGNRNLPSEDQTFLLSEKQNYQLLVTIQSKKPKSGFFDAIRLTDGQDIDYVDFTMELDCDSLKFEPSELRFTVKAKRTEAVTRVAQTTAVRGVHTLFILVYQGISLVYRIRLKMDVR